MNQQPFEKNTLEVFETIYGSRDFIDTPNFCSPMGFLVQASFPDGWEFSLQLLGVQNTPTKQA